MHATVIIMTLAITGNLIFGTVESASVTATLPSSTAILNGTKIDFVLDGFDPAPGNIAYTLLKFGYEKTGEAFSRLYNYHKSTSAFTLYSSIPPEFVGRLTSSKVGVKPMISVSPILFTDETYQFYFELDYETASGVAQVYSQKYQLQNVYSMQTFNDAESMQASKTLIEGSTGTIQCVVSSRPVSTVTWSYNNATINATQSSTTSTSGSIIKVTSVLRIRNPTLSLNREKVTCFASHQFSAVVNRTTTINVQYRPKNTSFSVIPATPKLNQNTTLTCSAVGKPSVTKYRFYVDDTSVGNSTSGSLTLNANDCTRYNGNYKCVPESSIGDGEVKSQSVVVTDAIKVSPRRSALIAIETKNITLTCDFSGCPLPTIKWQKNGSPLNRSGSSLQLSSVGKSDSGQYSCHAENGYTNASAQIQVTVNYKPMSTNFTASIAKPTEGSAVTFTCRTDSFQTAKYRFYRVDNGGDVLVSSSDSENSGVYTISSVSYSGAYNVTYKCVPYNLLGNSSAVTTTIEIQARPRIMVSAIPSTVNETQTAIIQCKVLAANPVPSLVIRNANGLSITHTNGNVTLSSVTADQDGMYTCAASNGIGQPVTGNTTLTVNHIPDKITLTSSNNKPVNGSSVTLTCSARGTPKPQYRFYNGLTNTIVQDSSSETYITGPLIYEIVTNYSAIFRCVPHNMMGNGVTTSIALDIQVPPKVSLSITPQTVNETGNANIACVVAAANPTPVITILNPMNRTVSHTDGAATLTNLTRNNAGIYSCSASNGVPGSPVTNTATLSVNHRPDNVKMKASSRRLLNGSAVTYTCSARASPPARFRFYKVTGSTVKLVQDSAFAVYWITKINYADYIGFEATVKCIPYNSLGDGPSRNATVYIQVNPLISVPSSVTVNEGKNANLTCTVVVANPAPAITWKGPANNVLSHTNGVLFMPSVSRSQNGTYTCQASNGHGMPATKTSSLFVYYGPEFTSNSSSIIACRPQRPIIRCVADGFPVPAVRVMFLNTEKVRGHGEVTHVITDLADSTFGVYTCLANNTVKKVNITRTLVKKDAPDPVTNVALKSNTYSIAVAWRLPVCKGVRGIKAIRVKYKNIGVSTWVAKNVTKSTSETIIDKLESDTEYEVQVFIVDGNDEEHPGLRLSKRTGVWLSDANA